ncbi:MAG: hypothetical protein OEY52_07540 [Gammaproteobacteria bacterium]|nr:hypothetical protein [Gammaproteobacteria bacterium]
MSENLQDGNVGNLGDILKHTALVQLARIFSETIQAEKYYLDSHSYLYQSRMASGSWHEQTQILLNISNLYQDYIDVELPYVNKGEYLCSSGLVHHLIPDAHLILCETNRTTREWLLQQLADNRVSYHTVKEQMVNWLKGRSFQQLPNLLALIDPFELTEDLWAASSQCLGKMLLADAPALILVFDYQKKTIRTWSKMDINHIQLAASISKQPYHLAVYASDVFVEATRERLGKMGWHIPPN